MPKVLIWSVDPWVLYGDEAAFDKRADVELYNEFLTMVLGVESDYEEEDRVALWKALVAPAYFQGNVDYYLKNRGQSVVTDDEGIPIVFIPVDGNPYEQPTTIKRSDGSVLYDLAFRDAISDQERALAAAPVIAGRVVCAVFSGGSDFSDGRTDAAGGYVDGDTAAALAAKGWNVFDTLKNNDAYHALQAAEGLIITGATGTNVNDVAVALITG